MTIELQAPTSRYTTTQTATQRLAPLGGFGAAADYVTRSQIDNLDSNWSSLDQSFYRLSPVSKALTDAYENLHKLYADWRDTKVDLINSRAPNLADQLKNLEQAKGIYSAAVAAGAKLQAQVTGKVQTIVVPETITAGNASVFVILGLAALLFVWPTREEKSSTALAMFPNTRRRRGRGFGALKVGQEVRPVRFTKAPAGNTFVTIAPDRVGRVVEVKRVGRGKNAVTRHFVEWRSMGRGAPAVSGWYDEEALTVE